MISTVRTLLAALLVLGSASGRVAAGGRSAPGATPLQAVTSGAPSIRIGVLRNGKYDVVSVPLEEYVSRVLVGETAPETPAAALEALAVVIRTYTVLNLGRHAAEGFDLCDQTHCQVMRTTSPVTDDAARATAGQILLYRGAPATVYYSASCGGRSEKPSHVWPDADDPPYLTIHDDDGCEGFPQWAAEVYDVDLQRALRAGGFKGTLRDVRVSARNASGRVERIALVGMQPAQISGQDLRMVIGRTLGFRFIQSTAFDIERTSRSTHFAGHGSGHGVGLCVIGSMKLAAKGQSPSEILARYFPGTQVGPVGARVPVTTAAEPISEPPLVLPAPAPFPVPAAPAPPRVAAEPEVRAPVASMPAPSGDAVPTGPVVVVAPGDAGERASLSALIERERLALARQLGVEPPRIRVRFFESTEEFERGSGRPSFELGALVGDEIQLAPLWLLRERGMLERTVRRQLAYAIVDDVLPARPAWVRAGASVYFADPEATSTARLPCPTDEELDRPVSIGALSDTLARARACFERQVSGGRDWRRVR